MPAAKPRYTPQPRMWSLPQVAAWFGKSEGWFRDHRRGLEAEGFPPYDELNDGWDAKAIETWQDRRSGLLPADAGLGENPWDKALGIGA